MVQRKLNLYEPFLPKDVCKFVNKYIKKKEISTYGTAINLFENKVNKGCTKQVHIKSLQFKLMKGNTDE